MFCFSADSSAELNYFTTDSQPVRVGRKTLSDFWPDFSWSWKLRGSCHGATCLPGRRVCLLYLTLYLIILVSQSVSQSLSLRWRWSGHVILLLTISQSVCPSWPRAPNCDSWPYFSLEENFGIAFRGASTLTSGRGCHVQGSQSFSVLWCYQCYYSLLLLILLCTKCKEYT